MTMLTFLAAAMLAGQPAPMNAEHYWTLKRARPTVCTAAARADGGEVVLFGLSGRLSFSIARTGLPQNTRTIELRLDDLRQAFPAKATGELIGEQGEGLSSASIVALRNARRLAVALDGRETMKLDLSGSGTAQLVDDLLDCSLGKAGWWDTGAPPTGRGPAEPRQQRVQSELLPPAPAGAKPGSIPMGPAGSK